MFLEFSGDKVHLRAMKIVRVSPQGWRTFKIFERKVNKKNAE